MNDEERELRFKINPYRMVSLREALGEEEWKKRVRERKTKWREKNREKIATYRASYSSSLTYEKKKQYERTRLEKIKANPELHERYKERKRKADKKRYWKGRTKPSERIATYQKKRRRGKKWQEWKKAQLERQGYRCAFCKADLRGNHHVDHIVPRFEGGGDEETNLWLLCPECNMQKGKKRVFLI